MVPLKRRLDHLSERDDHEHGNDGNDNIDERRDDRRALRRARIPDRDGHRGQFLPAVSHVRPTMSPLVSSISDRDKDNDASLLLLRLREGSCRNETRPTGTAVDVIDERPEDAASTTRPGSDLAVTDPPLPVRHSGASEALSRILISSKPVAFSGWHFVWDRLLVLFDINAKLETCIRRLGGQVHSPADLRHPCELHSWTVVVPSLQHIHVDLGDRSPFLRISCIMDGDDKAIPLCMSFGHYDADPIDPSQRVIRSTGWIFQVYKSMGGDQSPVDIPDTYLPLPLSSHVRAGCAKTLREPRSMVRALYYIRAGRDCHSPNSLSDFYEHIRRHAEADPSAGDQGWSEGKGALDTFIRRHRVFLEHHLPKLSLFRYQKTRQTGATSESVPMVPPRRILPRPTVDQVYTGHEARVHAVSSSEPAALAAASELGGTSSVKMSAVVSIDPDPPVDDLCTETQHVRNVESSPASALSTARIHHPKFARSAGAVTETSAGAEAGPGAVSATLPTGVPGDALSMLDTATFSRVGETSSSEHDALFELVSLGEQSTSPASGSTSAILGESKWVSIPSPPPASAPEPASEAEPERSPSHPSNTDDGTVFEGSGHGPEPDGPLSNAPKTDNHMVIGSGGDGGDGGDGDGEEDTQSTGCHNRTLDSLAGTDSMESAVAAPVMMTVPAVPSVCRVIDNTKLEADLYTDYQLNLGKPGWASGLVAGCCSGITDPTNVLYRLFKSVLLIVDLDVRVDVDEDTRLPTADVGLLETQGGLRITLYVLRTLLEAVHRLDHFNMQSVLRPLCKAFRQYGIVGRIHWVTRNPAQVDRLRHQIEAGTRCTKVFGTRRSGGLE